MQSHSYRITRKDRFVQVRSKKKVQRYHKNGINGSQQDPKEEEDFDFDDILQMSDLSEEALLHNLRNRYDRDCIYTYVGPILIAINPYKAISTLYEEEKMCQYYGKPIGKLEPHVFALADHAYTQLVCGGALDPANQSIIISGESGAGKTETTKIIMQYLYRATGFRGKVSEKPNGAQVHGDHALGRLEERVLDSNPLLESFGNAKTIRNDNSSRFGKFIEIQFDRFGKIVGAEVMNFLLEKTRIVSQSLEERNYHIFYQLLAGADDKLKKELRLSDPTTYEYLRHSQCYKIPGCNDVERFEQTKHCLTTIGIANARQKLIFELLAAILHLGNVKFKTDNEATILASPQATEVTSFVATLLGLPVEKLQRALLMRQLFVGGKIIIQQQNIEMVRDKRDALAKALYAGVFVWLVTELNRTISVPDNRWGFIGVLDIYGFEKFEWNTFEQLCINYANEKLQRHFNEHMLEVEQDEYTKEGIDWQHIQFTDNQQCLDLIESKVNGKPGIFITLDDIWRYKGEEANRKFVAILHAAFGRDALAGGSAAHKAQNPWYIHPKVDAHRLFGINHYAGQVIYDVSGFNEKNNETLNEDLKELIQSSTNNFIREIFSQKFRPMDLTMKRGSDLGLFSRRPQNGVEEKTVGKSRNLREISVGAQFRYQLQELMNKISIANPRYVRCIKPNEMKQAGKLDDEACARQLRYSGMMEAIKIRQRGFALRKDHDVFFYDHQMLAPNSENVEELLEELSQALGIGKEQWQLGATKVFLKRDVALKIEKMELLQSKGAVRTLQKWYRNIKRREAIVKIQCLARQTLAKKKLWNIRQAAIKILSRMRVFHAMRVYVALREEHRQRSLSAVHIQRMIRGHLARKRFMPQPLEALSAKELDFKIAEYEKAIEAAAAAAEFEKCAALQNELDRIMEARKSLRTAKELDVAIRETEALLERAAQEKQFSKCASLQIQLDAIKELRKNATEDLNELDAAELDDRIRNVQGDLDRALRDRAFDQCQQLQSRLEELSSVRKTKQTPRELEQEVAKLSRDIQVSLKRKDFETCSQLQKELQRCEERLAALPKEPTSQEPRGLDISDLMSISTAAKPSVAIAAPILTRATSASSAATFMSDIPSRREHFAPSMSVRSDYSGVSLANTAKSVTRVQPIKSISAYPLPLESSRASISELRGSTASVSNLSVSSSSVSMRKSNKNERKPLTESSRTVSRLRPSKPLIVQENTTVFEAAKLMKRNRTSAVLVTNQSNTELVGIFTDTDTARRVVSKRLDIFTTPVAHVMTQNPSCVTLEDSALDALNLMITGRFRHLPVTSQETGQIVGLLNVARCLYDAIRTLETTAASLQQELSKQTRGNSSIHELFDRIVSPTLEQIVCDLLPPPTVSFDSYVQDAVSEMAQSKQPAIVLHDGDVCGIFTTKDLLHRVIASNMPIASTRVCDVMTPNPECGTPEMTVLSAFHVMHEGNFLHLPVIHAQNQKILGVADVLSLTSASFGKSESCELSRVWQAMLESKDFGNEDLDDTESVSRLSVRSELSLRSNQHAKSVKRAPTHDSTKPVSSLRMSLPILVSEQATVLDAAELMRQKRVDAVLVISSEQSLTGILTETDICWRVMAKDLDPQRTRVLSVMTRDIQFVSVDDSALDALLLMHKGHFRHLPVIHCEDGGIAGILHIAKCVYDIAQRLEANTASNDKLKASFTSLSPSISHLTLSMVEKLSSPTLAGLLKRDVRAPRIKQGTSVYDALQIMSSARKAALIVSAEDPERLCGLFSPAQVLTNVLFQSLDLRTTRIESVMLSDPEIVYTSTTILEALHIMHDSQCLYLPVIVQGTEDTVAGLIDVLSLCYGTMDTISGKSIESLQELYNMALQLDCPSTELRASSRKRLGAQTIQKSQRLVSELRVSKVLTISEHANVKELIKLMKRRAECVLVTDSESLLCGIVTDTDFAHRVVPKRLEMDIVKNVMTQNPKFVSIQDSAMDALNLMLQGCFRHLPVVNAEKTSIIGILHIESCLFDAIRALQASEELVVQPLMQRVLSPSIRSLLGSKKRAPHVHMFSSIEHVCQQMESARKAAMIMDDDGSFMGIFTPQNLMENVLINERSLCATPVYEVMEKDCVFVTADTLVLDAMHLMHDKKTYYLTVIESESVRTPLDIMDVLTLSFGTFQTEDWRAFWDLYMQTERPRDEEDSVSMHSFQSSIVSKQIRTKDVSDGSVAKLGICKILTIPETQNIAQAAEEMSHVRTDAALVVDKDGVLKGILTDTDITQRVVALGNDPNCICVSEVMTRNPKYVSEQDSAMEAMYLMLEGKFRHLPVVDARKSVCGLLKIQKCLYDAIHRMEMAQNAASSSIYGKMLAPTIDKVMKMPPCVLGSESILHVARKMTIAKKAAFVVEEDPYTQYKRLIGILTPQHILLRVVACNKAAADITASDVMDAAPETIHPSMSLLDCLHLMHEQNLAYIPVLEPGTERILGSIDVLTLCYGAFAHSGPSGDWKAFWDLSLSLTDEKTRMELSKNCQRSVSALHPRQVLHIDEFITITEAARRMRRARVEAAVVTSEGELKGVLTDSDIAYRVLAKNIDPDTCSVASIMTMNPSCVRLKDTALEAMMQMLKGRCKHLIVMDSKGMISGMLDISRCLYDAIACMEKVRGNPQSAGDPSNLQRLARSMDKYISHDIEMAIKNEPVPPILALHTSATEAAARMERAKSSAVVLDENDTLVGIVTPRDLLFKLVSRNLSADNTPVHSIMTQDPEHILPHTKIVDGLKRIYDSGQLSLPVMNTYNEVQGMVDVLSLTYNPFLNMRGQSELNWRQFWNLALSLQDEASNDLDDVASVGTIEEFDRSELRTRRNQRLTSSASGADLGDSASMISAAPRVTEDTFVFKVSCVDEKHFYRIVCRYERLAYLEEQIKIKMSLPRHVQMELRYEDDDGDLAILKSDESLMEAVTMAKRANWTRLVLRLHVHQESTQVLKVRNEKQKRKRVFTQTAMAGAAALTLASAALFFLKRK